MRFACKSNHSLVCPIPYRARSADERVSELSSAAGGSAAKWMDTRLAFDILYVHVVERYASRECETNIANCISIVSEESDEAKEQTSKGRKLWVTFAFSLSNYWHLNHKICDMNISYLSNIRRLNWICHACFFFTRWHKNYKAGKFKTVYIWGRVEIYVKKTDAILFANTKNITRKI